MFNLLVLIACVPLCTSPVKLNSDDHKESPKASPPITDSFQHPKGIAWIGTWEAATAEAGRTGKPILLLSAAPQCRGIPGVW